MVFEGRTLVIGGAGYIGSHVLLDARERGAGTVALDNLSTGFADALPPGQIFVEGDLADAAAVLRACSDGVSAAMHFASFIQVGESVRDPAKYYGNNVAATVRLLEALCASGVKHFVFSSSAAVYGEPITARIPETHPTQPLNPYGRTKLMVEQMLPDYERAYGLKWVALRYFNAAGAHPGGMLGERHEPETHLIPLALRAANERLDHLTVYGTDYPTADGTCIRDYVHVCDLAEAHWLALDYLAAGGPSRAFNLGNGDGFSVRQVLDSVGRVTGKTVPVQRGERRQGDAAVLVADASLARSALGWRPQYSELDTIVAHAWGWERSGAAHNPELT
jgi:UDP-glucose 4-epimerase